MRGLLSQFDLGENIEERPWLGAVARLSPDRVFYSWWTGGEQSRLVHVLQTDFVSGLDDVRDSFEEVLGYAPALLRVREPMESFEQAILHKYVSVFKEPNDFENLRLYMNELYNDQPYHISFAALGAVDDKISIISTDF